MSQLQNSRIFHKYQVTEHKFQHFQKPYGEKLRLIMAIVPVESFFKKCIELTPLHSFQWQKPCFSTNASLLTTHFSQNPKMLGFRGRQHRGIKCVRSYFSNFEFEILMKN